MDKGLCLTAMIFCFLPLVGACFLTCWVLDDDRKEQKDEEKEKNEAR